MSIRQIFSVFLVALFLLPGFIYANFWQDLWLNKNQQAAQLLQQKQNKEAAKTFTDNNWKGSAYYKAQDYKEAYHYFQQDHSAAGLYNQGNALAQMHKYQKAIKAYQQALEKNLDFNDAKHNLELVKKLLQQQKEQQNQANSKDKEKQQDKKDQKNQQDKNQQSQQNNQDKQSESSEKGNRQDQSRKNTDHQQNQQNQQKNATNKGDQFSEKSPQKDKKTPKSRPDANQKNQSNQQPKKKSLASASDNSQPQKSLHQKNTEALLAKIPDDPGGLLKQKFLRDYKRHQQETR